MIRKNITVGLRVIPSGKGFTKHWNLSAYKGTVTNIDHPRYIVVKWDGWDGGTYVRPIHIEPLKQV